MEGLPGGPWAGAWAPSNAEGLACPGPLKSESGWWRKGASLPSSLSLPDGRGQNVYTIMAPFSKFKVTNLVDMKTPEKAAGHLGSPSNPMQQRVTLGKDLPSLGLSICGVKLPSEEQVRIRGPTLHGWTEMPQQQVLCHDCFSAYFE